MRETGSLYVVWPGHRVAFDRKLNPLQLCDIIPKKLTATFAKCTSSPVPLFNPYLPGFSVRQPPVHNLHHNGSSGLGKVTEGSS